MPEAADPPNRRVGFAVVGLGRLTIGHLMEALGKSNCVKAVALVSGDSAKARKLARQIRHTRRGDLQRQRVDCLHRRRQELRQWSPTGSMVGPCAEAALDWRQVQTAEYQQARGYLSSNAPDTRCQIGDLSRGEEVEIMQLGQRICEPAKQKRGGSRACKQERTHHLGFAGP